MSRLTKNNLDISSGAIVAALQNIKQVWLIATQSSQAMVETNKEEISV